MGVSARRSNWKAIAWRGPLRGFDPKHRFIDDLKMKSFISSVAFADRQLCNGKFLREFAAACRSMSPLVEFATKALGYKY